MLSRQSARHVYVARWTAADGRDGQGEHLRQTCRLYSIQRYIPDCHLEILDGHCERETRLRNTAMEESPSSRTSSAATDVMVDPNLTVMRRVTPLPFEMVVREYMSRSKTTTSLWHAYQRGERRFCGHELPEGLGANAQLPEPILTPTHVKNKHERSRVRHRV